jgi:hypothetical protein
MMRRWWGASGVVGADVNNGPLENAVHLGLLLQEEGRVPLKVCR